MGLDMVELVLAVEEKFNISIDNLEAENATTVGRLHDLVVSRLRLQDSTQCLTSAAFYRTRRGLVEVLGVARRDIRPTTSLEALFPVETRRERWAQFQAAIPLRRAPDLQPPGWILHRSRVDFPLGNATVGDLARDVLTMNRAQLLAEVEGLRQRDVWAVLQQVIIDQIGVRPEQITPKAAFVDDLGVD